MRFALIVLAVVLALVAHARAESGPRVALLIGNGA
jgi:hypothetical protein